MRHRTRQLVLVLGMALIVALPTQTVRRCCCLTPAGSCCAQKAVKKLAPCCARKAAGAAASLKRQCGCRQETADARALPPRGGSTESFNTGSPLYAAQVSRIALDIDSLLERLDGPQPPPVSGPSRESLCRWQI